MPTKLGWGMAKLLQVTRPTAMYNCMSHPKKELGKQGVPKNYAGRRAPTFCSRVLFLAACQMARQKAILLTKSARL